MKVVEGSEEVVDPTADNIRSINLQASFTSVSQNYNGGIDFILADNKSYLSMSSIVRRDIRYSSTLHGNFYDNASKTF